MKVNEHSRAVVVGRSPLGVGKDVGPEAHPVPVALMWAGRPFPARCDDRRALIREVLRHRNLPLQPVLDRRPQPWHAGRHPRHHRRRLQVHHEREQVVEHCWLLDAEPVLAGMSHRSIHRASPAFFANSPPFLETSTQHHAALQDSGRSDGSWFSADTESSSREAVFGRVMVFSSG